MAMLPVRSVGQRTPVITGLAAFSLLSGIIGLIVGLVAGVDVLLLSLPVDVAARSFLVGMVAVVIGAAEIGVAIGLLRMSPNAWIATTVTHAIALAYSPLGLAITLHLVIRSVLGNPFANAIFAALLLWQFIFAVLGSILVLELITRAPQRTAFGRFRPSDFVPEPPHIP